MSYNNSITILYIIITILVLVIVYLLYKTRKIQSETGKIEEFAETTDKIIDDKIKAIYNADIDAIRNLSDIATKITEENDTLTIPVGNTKMSGNTEINGNLTVKGNVEFVNKDDGFMNTMPKCSIIAFYADTVPKGWAQCDGKTYKLNSVGVAYEVAASDTTGIITPDLRGRMIIGVGQGNSGLTNRKRNDAGGFETHTLTEAEMPSHNHNLSVGLGEEKGKQTEDKVSMFYNRWPWEPRRNLIHHAGGNQPHNNMPPWYAINYIMKL